MQIVPMSPTMQAIMYLYGGLILTVVFSAGVVWNKVTRIEAWIQNREAVSTFETEQYRQLSTKVTQTHEQLAALADKLDVYFEGLPCRSCDFKTAHGS